MTNPDELHAVLRDYEEFDDLLEDLDKPVNIDELRARLEAWGSHVTRMFDEDLEEVHAREVGLIRLAWEAHHKEKDHDKPEIRS